MCIRDSCVTVSLDIKFISPTKAKDEILGKVKILKKTKSMVFISCNLISNSKIVAVATGIWKKLKVNQSELGPGG